MLMILPTDLVMVNIKEAGGEKNIVVVFGHIAYVTNHNNNHTSWHNHPRFSSISLNWPKEKIPFVHKRRSCGAGNITPHDINIQNKIIFHWIGHELSLLCIQKALVGQDISHLMT